ncbi:hypothetical protein [Blastococcus deserti]|uniref:PASTA domain-containing protein n=1 Tax=Blastococcus deserti TaxID=2259033 RepID=A0ABW4XFE6_9ACTN
MGLDIPDLSSDLRDRDGWEANAADACVQAGFRADCVTFAYSYFATDGDGNGRTRIDDPGTDYEPTYAACPVESITPPTGEGTEPIPVGTEIAIVVVCTLPEAQPDAVP